MTPRKHTRHCSWNHRTIRLQTEIVQTAVVDTFSTAVEPKVDARVDSVCETNEFVTAELKESTESNSADIKKLQEEMFLLRADLADKDKTITDLKYRVEHLESYSRRNAVRIAGIPESPNPKNDPGTSIAWATAFAKSILTWS